MKPHTLLYLSRKDVESVHLSMADIIQALENMFVWKGKGEVEMPPKPGIHPLPNSFIHAMPAHIPALKSAGLKWVSGFPQNLEKGLPYISGLLILNDPETGFPLSVMDCTWITAQRTGAATAVAAKHLARKESSTLGIIACGVQGRSNLEALHCAFDLKKVKAYDIVPEIAERYAREMSGQFGVEIEVVKELSQAVKGCDLVVTSGPILKKPKPLIEPGWLQKGAFACTLDFDSYWQPGAFQEAHKIATDDHRQMEYYRQEGYFGETPIPYADLGELAIGEKPGRESDEEITMAINLGLALDDMAVAIVIYQRAREMALGVDLEL